jgi:hypothetical protein
MEATENGILAEDKIKTLITIYHARLTNCPASLEELEPNDALLCVVDNGVFAAVAYCYDNKELKSFKNIRDYRPKTWMIIDKSTVESLIGFKK